ncbi:MAG: peptidylprolyl isomerase [Planctomycetota bacterium]|nr:peptidylprolyl isomerase [Planctomycetota bacterium]
MGGGTGTSGSAGIVLVIVCMVCLCAAFAPSRCEAEEPVVWAARVNGVALPKAVLDRRLPLALAQLKSLDPSFDPEREKDRVERARKGLIEEMIKVELLKQYARGRKLAAPPKALEDFMKAADADAMERRGKPLEKFLKDNGESIEDFREFHAARLALENEIRSGVTREEAARFYEERRDYLPLRRAAHILVGFRESKRPSGAGRTREEAKKKAEALVEKLKGGADFAALARAESDCPSRENGGDLGFFPRKGHGSMTPELGIATYMLAAPGDITGVIESDFGFHIVRLLEVRAFEQIEPIVRDMMVYEKVQEKVEELRKSARIEWPPEGR